MRSILAYMLCSLVGLVTLGCGSGEDDPFTRDNPRGVGQVPGGVVVDPAGMAQSPTHTNGTPPVDPAVVDSAEPLEAATADTVGTRGKEYGGGIITEPIRQYFRVQDHVKLQHLDYAMKLYYAEHGRYPATMEQYIEEIARPNMVQLPELPSNRQYVYDPQQGKLFVQSK